MLPARVRWMAGLCAVVCALTMWGATTDFFTGLRIDALKTELAGTTAKDYLEEFGLQSARAQVAHYATMRGPRMLLSLLLSLAAGLGFAAALRILRPRGLRREGMRVLLMRSVFWTALFRTITGAADAGTASYSAKTVKRLEPTFAGKEQWLSTFPAESRKEIQDTLSYLVDHLSALGVGAAIGWTLVTAMVFVAFWRYFGRDDVKNLLAAADDASPST